MTDTISCIPGLGPAASEPPLYYGTNRAWSDTYVIQIILCYISEHSPVSRGITQNREASSEAHFQYEMATPDIYAVLGSTGNCGTALVENLLTKHGAVVHAYCRNRTKLLRLLPQVEKDERVKIFEGNVQDVDLLVSCLRGARAVFLVASTNDNIPGCRVGQDTALAVIEALQKLKSTTEKPPKLLLLSSATIDPHFSRHVPWLLQLILLRSASHVYQDLRETERILRAQESWLTTVYVKPGALSVDAQRGHRLSLTDQDGPLSYLDLAAAMIEAADDEEGRYDLRNVSVVPTNGPAKFPAGTPMCILMGLLKHYLPFLHGILPATAGPR